MGIPKMNEENNLTETHRKIAMEFLMEANSDQDSPVQQKLIEEVYDLFAAEGSGSLNFQRALEKIIAQKRV